MSVEEVFHLRKDTKVYIIFNSDNMRAQENKLKTKKSFELLGYENIKYQPYGDPAEDYGYRLSFGGDFQTDPRMFTEKSKWYAFANVLRKIRKEETPVIITFAGHSLVRDIDNKIEQSDFEIIGYHINGNNMRRSDPKAGMFITPLGARQLFKNVILESRIVEDINDFMIGEYNKMTEEKYRYLSVCEI